jgi:hypothetical protein
MAGNVLFRQDSAGNRHNSIHNTSWYDLDTIIGIVYVPAENHIEKVKSDFQGADEITKSFSER